jgi:sugar phosphate isomerase/epimerase
MSSPLVGPGAWPLSCADSAFPKLSHPIALAVIKDLGIDFVDVCVFAGHRHNPPESVVADPMLAAERVGERVQRAGLAVADVFVILSDPYDQLAINHPNDDVREDAMSRLVRVVEFSAALGSPGMTMLPGVEFAGVDPHVSRQTASAELQRLAQSAGESGVALSIEPHYQSIAAVPDTTLELLDAAPDLRLTLDHGHFVFQGITQSDVDLLIPATRHVQLRQAAVGDMQTPARQGDIDYGVLLAALAAAGYSGFLGLEYQWDHWMDFNRVDCISETAELRDLLYTLGSSADRTKEQER